MSSAYGMTALDVWVVLLRTKRRLHRPTYAIVDVYAATAGQAGEIAMRQAGSPRTVVVSARRREP
jgi:hypothetical protein